MSTELTILFRPVGQGELALIRDSGFRQFPPRLPAQPFFYPVLNEEYAAQIARLEYIKMPLRELSGMGFASRYEQRS